MPRIAVFDSGLGSLSIIRAIRREMGAELVYFADQASFPYGSKSPDALLDIIQRSISMLDRTFRPDLIVVASNTPSLLLGDLLAKNDRVVGVLPPVEEALEASASAVCILATSSVVEHYRCSGLPYGGRITLLDASPLVGLVESGAAFADAGRCRDAIKNLLQERFEADAIDVATLSSTHLSFLGEQMRELFPGVRFLDPAAHTAKKISKMCGSTTSGNTLRIYASGDPDTFQKKLSYLGIHERVGRLEI